MPLLLHVSKPALGVLFWNGKLSSKLRGQLLNASGREKWSLYILKMFPDRNMDVSCGMVLGRPRRGIPPIPQWLHISCLQAVLADPIGGQNLHSVLHTLETKPEIGSLYNFSSEK